jgi:5-methylcytosine-specific restriction endonuclease McrA
MGDTMAVTGFTPAQKHLVLERDGHKCPICGRRAREVNHRANRGHGGFKAGNSLANACAICTMCNGAIEDDATAAETARARGVKISRYSDPTVIAYRHPLFACDVWLKADGSYTFDPPMVEV